MRLTETLVLATTNSGKFEEFKHLFAKYPNIEPMLASSIIFNAEKIGKVEIHSTYFENAVAKARLVNASCHYPSLADDSGLEVDTLGGKPGIHSARFAPPAAGKTQDQANIEFLLKQLNPDAPTAARFVCHLALVVEGILLSSTGHLEGQIIHTPRGNNGFGYDPIFVPKGFTKTLAELTDDEKNSISHRARALHSLMEKLNHLSIVLAKP